jgi:hypothetical protein
MRTFVNKPGSSRADFNNAPLEPAKSYRCLQHYLQALLHHCPHDVQRLVECPEGEDVNDWICSCCRQFVQELNYYAYEHRDVSTAATEPAMEFDINGKKVSYLSAAHQTPKAVPAIDYITQTIDSATGALLDQRVFPPGRLEGKELAAIGTFLRRLYRIFVYSYFLHRDIFDRLEQRSHICERFTKFARMYGLLKPEDIFIPDEYWETREK